MASIPSSSATKDKDLQRRLDHIRETQRVHESDFVSLGGRKLCDWLLLSEQIPQVVELLIHFYFSNLIVDEILDSIVYYTRMSTTLRSVVFFGSGREEEDRVFRMNTWMSPIIDAIADNPSITNIAQNQCLLSPIDLGRLVRNTRSLETLHMNSKHNFGDLSSEQNRELAEAFRSNGTLKSVQFTDGVVVTDEILSAIVSNKQLQELCFSCERLRSPRMSVYNVLRSANPSLLHLAISQHTFKTTDADSVIHALPFLPPTLTTLSIVNCGFDTETSFSMFVDHLYRLRSLLELRLAEGKLSSAGLITPDLFCKVAMIPNLDTLRLGLIGSLNMTECFVALAGCASQWRLRCLHLYLQPGDTYSCYDTLSLLIPEFCFLRELTVKSRRKNCLWSPLVDALRRNGNLFRVEFSRIVHPDERRLLDAYGQRNQVVPQLLAAPIIVNEMNHAQGTSDPGIKSKQLVLSLVPALIFSVMAARRTAANTVLNGLLALGESVGKHNVAK